MFLGKVVAFLRNISFFSLFKSSFIDAEPPFNVYEQGGRIKMRSPPKVLTGNFRPSQLSFFLS